MSGAEKLELRASPLRRALGIAMLWGLGLLLLALVVGAELSLPGRALLLVIAAGALWVGEKMRRATAGALWLTEAGLVSAEGRVIAPMDEIERVDRGAFAFKPSNGFVLRLSTRHPWIWAPGLYWRLGRRVAVGGVTAAAPGKAMAEALALRIAQRA